MWMIIWICAAFLLLCQQSHSLRTVNRFSLISVSAFSAAGPLSHRTTLCLFPRVSFASKISEKKQELLRLAELCQPNGLSASKEMQKTVDAAAKELEKLNPTRDPAYSLKMNGFWRMIYSDFGAAASSSSGKLGPFVGDVFQDLDSKQGLIKNLLALKFPPVYGGLIAKQKAIDGRNWQIEFLRVKNYLAGIPFQSKAFPAGKFIRRWRITYLDDDFRIMRPYNPEQQSEAEAFLTFFVRDEFSRKDVQL